MRDGITDVTSMLVKVCDEVKEARRALTAEFGSAQVEHNSAPASVPDVSPPEPIVRKTERDSLTNEELSSLSVRIHLIPHLLRHILNLACIERCSRFCTISHET